MPKPLVRWLLVTSLVCGGLLGLSGRWADPWLWGYALSWAAVAFYGLWFLDEDLARERFHPPTSGADAAPLRAVQITGLGHVVVGALDMGRWHLTAVVPSSVRAAALAAMTLAAI